MALVQGGVKTEWLVINVHSTIQFPSSYEHKSYRKFGVLTPLPFITCLPPRGVPKYIHMGAEAPVDLGTLIKS